MLLLEASVLPGMIQVRDDTDGGPRNQQDKITRQDLAEKLNPHLHLN